MDLLRIILPLLLAAQTHAAAPTFRNGEWRALLIRKDGNDISFNFDVKDSAGKQVLYLRNAGERILVDDITRSGDSIFIKFPFYESQLRARVTPEGNLEGVWLRHLAADWLMVPFRAFYGEAYRFPAAKPAGNAKVAGRWAAVFRATKSTDTTFRVGEFQQSGSRVTGTFLDAGGDLRYLEGSIGGDSLKLSCFDGTHAYFFTAKLEGDKLTGGYYYAGPTAVETWTAHRDPKAKLEDQFAMTKWKKDMPFTFTFRDLDGKNVSLADPRFKNKVVIIQIMGSWCPNCMDETRFLSGFYNEYRNKGVEVIALAYERSTDFQRSQASVRTFQKRFRVNYPMLITGAAVGDPDRAAKTLPQLESIVNFPTTIFVGKSGHIERIHTGFSGPGTGQHYEDQKQEFYTLVNDLLAAK
ncbi:TlpA disulfide reductase family protein [Puia sp.]|jgi:thiol-disulfide isomerase/thioredoxin|uniref:TlpA disulfide reductase family protein n=1 Tax=Puia sp. TaxID=2045100 RepID=UPI002F417FAC